MVAAPDWVAAPRRALMVTRPWLHHLGVVGERSVGRVRLAFTGRWAYACLLLMGVLFVGATLFSAFRLHDAFITSADDLSNIDQVVWNSWRGELLVRTTGTRQLPRYGEHLELIWIAFGPLFALWNNVKILIVAQTLALAVGVLPIFWLGVYGPRQGVRRDWLAGLLFAAAYLLCPFLNRAALAEVHAAPFAVAPLLFAFWYASRRRYPLVWGWSVLILLVKEEQALLVTMLGLWLVMQSAQRWRAGRALSPALAGDSDMRRWVWEARTHGLGLIAVSLTWLGIAVFGIINSYAEVRTGTEQSIFFERYAAFGTTPLEIVFGVLTRPDLVLTLLATPDRLRFLLEVAASTGALWLFGLEGALLALPLFGLNLLSDYSAQHGGLQHYAAPLLPGLFVASVLGYHRLLGWVAPLWQPALRAALLLWLTGSALATTRLAPASPLAADFWLPPVTAHHRLLARFAAQIPPDAALSATRQLHPHLSHRRYITRFPRVGEATWVLLDVTSDRHTHPHDLHAAVLDLLANGWGIVDGADGYLLLRQGAGASTIPAEFATFGPTTRAPIAPLDIIYRSAEGTPLFHLRGYDLFRDFWGRVGVRYHLARLAPLPAEPSFWPLLIAAPIPPDAVGQPLPETVDQPLVLPLWLPPSQWVMGQSYAIETLPRAVSGPFRPALGIAFGPWYESAPLSPTIEGHPPGAPIVAHPPSQPVATLGEWYPQDGFARSTLRDWPQWVSNEQPRHAIAATFGDIIGLHGWTLTQPQGGTPATIRLVWQALAPIPTSWRIFVHVVPVEGAPIPLAQADHLPTRSTLSGPQPAPTSWWQPGEIVIDDSSLDLTALPSGTYRLLIGLYDSTGARLRPTPDPDQDNALLLGTITLPLP